MITQNTSHGVLHYPPGAPLHLSTVEQEKIRHYALAEPLHTWTDLAEMALAHKIASVWVMTSADLYSPSQSHGDWSIKPHERNKHTASVSVWKRGHKQKGLEIIFPQYTSWSEILDGVAASELLGALYYVEGALGVPVGGSPGRAGWAYLKTIHPEWVEEVPGFDWKANHFTASAAPDIIWQLCEHRALSEHESQLRYVHKADKSAAYPYASTRTDIGVGTPVYVDHGHDMDDTLTSKGTYRPSQAIGVWRITITDALSSTTLNGMPPAWDERKQSGWVMGPIINLLRKVGYKVTVHEGWVFPERHDLLVKWGNGLWDIRQELNGIDRKSAKLAAKMTKFLANATLGLTAFRDFEPDDEMRRPDIRGQVIAAHRELTWHNIDAVRKGQGITPAIVYMDAAYYLSNEPDGRKVFPELLKREGKFGGFRYEGRIGVQEHFSYTFKGDSAPPPWDGTLIDLIGSTRYSEGNKLEVLNAKGWER